MDALPAELVIHIFTFLEFRQAIALQRLSSSIYAASNTLPNHLMSNLDLRNNPIPSEWVTRYAHTLHFLVWNKNLSIRSLLEVIGLNQSLLQEVDLSYVILENRADVLACMPQLTKLTLVSCNLTDSALEALHVMPLLNYLKINHNPRLTGRNLVDLPNEFVSLSFEGCHLIEFNTCKLITEKSAAVLTELNIHGRYYSSDEVGELLSIACEVTQFNYGYANYLDSSALDALRPQQLTRIRLLNSRHLQNSDFCRLLSQCTRQLVVIDFTNCRTLEDYALNLIARNCPDVQELCLRLCRGILDAGVLAIFHGCLKLRNLNLVDTLITDNALPLDQHYRFYENIREINLDRCYRISFLHAMKILRRFKKIKVTLPQRGGWKYLMPMHSWV